MTAVAASMRSVSIGVNGRGILDYISSSNVDEHLQERSGEMSYLQYVSVGIICCQDHVTISNINNEMLGLVMFSKVTARMGTE